MNFSAIKTALHAWAFSTVPVQTIFANQNGNVPPLPFCTLFVQPVAFIGQDESSVDIGGVSTYTGQREISVSVQYFGANAMQNAIDLAESLEADAARALLAVDGLVFVDRNSGVNDLSEVLDTGFEERAGIDLMFRIASVRTENTGLIESTEVTQTIKKPDDSSIVRTEIIGV